MSADPVAYDPRPFESDVDRIRFGLAAATQLAAHLDHHAQIDEIDITPDGVVTVLFVSATEAARTAHTLGLRGPTPVTDDGRALRWTGMWADAEVVLEGLGRPRTPPRQVFTSNSVLGGRVTRREHTIQRTCNGCGHRLGDASPDELAAATYPELQGPPDVRMDCPWCVTAHGPTGTPT